MRKSAPAMDRMLQGSERYCLTIAFDHDFRDRGFTSIRSEEGGLHCCCRVVSAMLSIYHTSKAFSSPKSNLNLTGDFFFFLSNFFSSQSLLLPYPTIFIQEGAHWPRAEAKCECVWLQGLLFPPPPILPLFKVSHKEDSSQRARRGGESLCPSCVFIKCRIVKDHLAKDEQ